MKKILTILLLFIGLQVSGQVNWTPGVGAWQLKDTTGGKNVRFRSSAGVITPVITQPSLSDSLRNYARIQDGVITEPTVTTNGDSLIIGSGVVRINGTNINFTGETFADIPPSGGNLSRILIVYSNTSGVLDTISGMQSNNPVRPDLPSNTQPIVSVSVNDAGLGAPEIDLSGYAKLNGSNFFTGLQEINTGGGGTISARYQGQIESYGFRLWMRNRVIGSGTGISDFEFRSIPGDNDNSSFSRNGGANNDITWNKTTGIWDFKQMPTVNGDPIGGGSSYTFTSPLTETSGTVSIDLLPIPISDSDIISALTGATYSNNRSTITPAGSKIMYTGQLYDDGTYTYIAISNNSIRRW